MPLIDSLSAEERMLFTLAAEREGADRQRQKLISTQNVSGEVRQKSDKKAGRPTKYDTSEIMKRFELLTWSMSRPNIKAFCAEENIPERTFRHLRAKWLSEL